LKFTRLKNRAYRDHAMLDRRVVVTHAEYGLVDGDRLLARIIRNGNKWIALQVSEANQFGRPVSPINYVLLRDVKEWALERFAK
jgi:hypothetical protein